MYYGFQKATNNVIAAFEVEKSTDNLRQFDFMRSQNSTGTAKLVWPFYTLFENSTSIF